MTDRVIKVINAPGWTAIGYLSDRISLHNYLFPETTLSVIGYGKTADGYMCAIVEQPYIVGNATNAKEVALTVTDAGFHVIDGVRIPYLFFTENLCLGDLHEGNVLKTPGGELMFIDCDIAINLPEMGYGGKWTVPEITFNDESVKKIDAAISAIIPTIVPAFQFLSDNPDIKEILVRHGRCDEPVKVIVGGRTADAIFQVSGKNPEKIFVMTTDKLKRYTTIAENPEIFESLTSSSDKDFVFDIESGRLKKRSMLKKTMVLTENTDRSLSCKNQGIAKP